MKNIKLQKNIVFISKNKGFTLVELLVATTIFTMIIVIGIGSLLSSSNYAKKTQKMRVAVDNINFAMESMTRELRMGTKYYCGDSFTFNSEYSTSDCPNGNSIIAFTSQEGSIVAYMENDNNWQRCENSNCSDIISPEVKIDKLKFYVNGTGLNDKEQPSARILIKGSININGSTPTPFALQTMASQRSLEK